MTTHTSFADVFPAAEEAQWLKAVERVLKDVPFQSLTGTTADGLEIQPLYDAAQGPRAFKAKSGDWTALSRIDHPDVEAAITQAQIDLDGGATGLHVVFSDAVSAHGVGLLWQSSAKMRTFWTQIALQNGLRIELDLGPKSRLAAAALAEYIHSEGLAPNLVSIGFGLDPLGAIAKNGGGENWEKSAGDFAETARQIAAYGFGGKVVSCDGSVINAAGGSEAQELAFVLASGVAYLKALEAAGLDLNKARDLIGFRLAADADEFIGVAKFRALRLLWARVEAACGLTPKPIDIFGKASWAMMSKADPWVNVLRNGMAAFAAGIGGADAVSLLPLTHALGLPDAFARRLARNTQLVLLKESHLGQVADAAAGAGGFEALTAELCAAAWTEFQKIEAHGGLYQSLKSGVLQKQVLAAREARLSALKSGKAKLIGVTIYQNKQETPVDVLAPLHVEPVGSTEFAALSPIRFAEGFEA